RVVALGDTAGHLQVHTLMVERLFGDQFADEGLPLRVAVRVGKPDAVEAALQAPEVMGQTKRLAMINRHKLVDTVAVNKAAIEDRDLRVFEWQELAVEIDDHGELPVG